MELPHDSNGDMDWNTLGNMLTAHILGEVLHARYVDWKYGSVAGRDVMVDTHWQFAYEKDDIIVLKKTNPNSPLLAFMGRGVIQLPMDDIILFIKDISHREQWDKHLVNIEVLRELSSTDFLGRMHHKARKCVIRAERDWLYYERACHVENKFVMTALSVDLPEYPPIPGLTRSRILPGSGWVLEPYDGSNIATLVSYLAHLDLRSLPPVFINNVQKRQVMAVRSIRNILTPSFSPFPSPSRKNSRQLRKKKMMRQSTESLPHIPDLDVSPESDTSPNDGRLTPEGPTDNWAGKRDVPFEDPVSVYAFIKSNRDMSRMDSVPWEIDHHWEGDRHSSHTHSEVTVPSPASERSRSYSEGDAIGSHSNPIVPAPPMTLQQIVEETLEYKRQVT